MSDDTTLSTKGLDKVLKALKGKLPITRVGVLGGKDIRQDPKSPSNATVGAAHEFGTETVPQRSFLRIPIADQLDAYLDHSGAFDPDVLKQVVAEGSIAAWMRKVGIVAETIVHDAFDSGGFGKWRPLSNATKKRKKNNQILVETQQLRNSITSDVVE